MANGNPKTIDFSGTNPTTLNEEAYLLMERWYPNFKNLSMDRQGELSLQLADRLRSWIGAAKFNEGK